MVAAGIVKVPGGTVVMTSIPDKHYAEFCNLLTEECKRLGLNIEFEDPISKRQLKPEEAAKKQEEYVKAQSKVQKLNQEKLAEFGKLRENQGLSPEEIENKFRVYQLMNVGQKTKVMTPLEVVKLIGDETSLKKDEDKDKDKDDHTSSFGVSGISTDVSGTSANNSSSTSRPLTNALNNTNNNNNISATPPAPAPASNSSNNNNNTKPGSGLTTKEEQRIAKALRL